ncbi:MAG: antibiotic biosynthesis monooxygenase [Betaproteobacteria bacterium]|nr:antibiotic biosynthesis monooxygenase [Betaproteobacteria bacterium]
MALCVHIRIKPDRIDEFMARVGENGRAARDTEPGCRGFDILVDPNDPTKVMLYEVYDSEAAFELHQQTPHFRKYLETALPCLESRERQFFRRVAP